MTQEEKAQAYDEALERARKQKYDYQKEFDKTDKNSQLAGILRAGISAIELAFPELAESEDERIRKMLISLVKHHSDVLEQAYEKEMLAWLEKQKEQKPLSTEETELNSIAFLEQMGYTCIPPGAKTAEWSEEDERILKGIIGLIDHDQHYGVSNKEMISWLKDLHPPKDCSDCAKHLEGYISGRCDAENKLLEQFGALITPEDELHIKPRWKPSEEQMEALNEIINTLAVSKHPHESDYLFNVLNGLRKDLKKLWS